MKDFEFITEADILKIHNEGGKYTTDSCHDRGAISRLVNKLLNEKSQKGWCDGDGTMSGQSYMCDEPDDPDEENKSDTHEAFVFLRPIEEEKETCVFSHKALIRENREYSREMIPDNVNPKIVAFCPKCGEKI